jgi:peptide/nickel transport system permease protein
MSTGVTHPPASLASASPERERTKKPWWKGAFFRNPIGLIGAVIVGITILLALFAPLVAPHDPDDQGATRLLGPSRDHLLGTDELGRDTFSRIIFGSRVSLEVGIIAVAVSLLLGGVLGMIAGFYGGRIDSLVMRFVDILFAFPGLILAIVIAGLLGPNSRNAMIAIGIIYAPAFARVIRGSVLSVKNELYLEAGRVAGASNWRLIARHVVPNIVAPLIVLITVYLSSAILAEAGLSFLGLGTQPPEPSWGGMLNAARTYMELNSWMAIAPGFAIAIVVLGLNFLGDGLRDVLDPRLRMR